MSCSVGDLRAFDDSKVAFRAGTERLKRLLVSLAFAGRKRDLIAVELHKNRPQPQSGIVRLNLARGRGRSRVAIKCHSDFWVWKLKTLHVHDVAPKYNLLSLGRKFVTGMSRGMTAERRDLHAVNDLIGVAKRVPLSGLDVWRRDPLCTLEELLRILRRLGGDFRRQPKVAICLCDVDVSIWKDDLSVRSGQAADVVGVEVRDQDDVDFFRRVSCAAEVARQVPELSPTKPGAGSRID